SGTLLTFWNRRMRTRMYGGVRGRGLAAPSYSISFIPLAGFNLMREEMDVWAKRCWKSPA
ncbi:hypothetical protein, partial [Paenibacillus sp. CGMCC 1.18879]|uniref:hypothetical protein n=1 Tax=Paenibacillus sp. CGMCC 1.18879 TaxID=2834466 RepID=UPI001CAA11BE